MIYPYFILTFIFSLFSILTIHLIWGKINHQNKYTSSGAGYGLSILILFIAYYNSYEDIFFFILVFLLSSVYLIDDLKTLNFKVRIGLQISLGAILFYFVKDNFINNLILSFFVIIILSFSLTNLINFNDGSDLHIVVMISIYLISVLLIDKSINTFETKLIIGVLKYLLVFSFFNIFKISYFGDSGCYIISSLILLLLMSNLSINNLFLFIICFIFYAIDTFYFLILRLKNRENLLTRSYYHLYQNLQINKKGYFYLIPGVLNTLIILIFFYFYNNFNFSFSNIFIISLLSFINYTFMRFYYYK